MLQLTGVSYRYAGYKTEVLHDIDLRFEDGEIVGLVGPNEAGKSTLCLVASGLAPASIGGSLRGELTIDGESTAGWSTPQLAERFKGNGWISNTIGNPLDTTIALQHLIFEGTLDKFPGLKVLAAHGGGYLPSYKARGDFACFVSPQNCNPNIVLKKKPSEYVNQLHFDAMVFTGEGLRHLVSQVGASQLMLGTDHPIPWETAPVDHVMGAPISDEEKAAILGENAAKLFGIKVAG